MRQRQSQVMTTAMGAVDPEVRVFLRHLAAGGGGPIERLPPVKARRVLAGLQSEVKASPAFMRGARVEDKTVRLDVPGGTSDVRLTIVRPTAAGRTVAAAPPPAFMFFHGGGWVLGDFPTHERMVRDLVAASKGAVAIFVNYTPSPEVGYGVAIEQAYAATKWVAENGASIGVDGRRLAVTGNSVGGNMATVVALMARHRGDAPALRAQVLFWPVVDTNFERPSYKRFADGFFLTRGMMKWFWDNYTRDKAERRELCACPIRAKPGDLVGLPPTLIQTAESDVLRDEGEAYGRKLSAAGVEVTSVRYNGMIHDFTLLNGISTVPAVRSAIEQAGAYLSRHLA